jgi:bacterioferritin-associated ferredoxin
MYMPTPGSNANCESDWPTPRMNTCAAPPLAPPPDRIVTFGAVFATSRTVVAPLASSIAPLTAVIAIGVSCSRCDRNCAVTMISAPSAPVLT